MDGEKAMEEKAMDIDQTLADIELQLCTAAEEALTNGHDVGYDLCNVLAWLLGGIA